MVCDVSKVQNLKNDRVITLLRISSNMHQLASKLTM